MEIRYIRKLMTSHMILEQQERLSVWEQQMIAHTSLERILFAEHVIEDGRNSLWYDITGKQSIDILFEAGELQYGLLCNLLAGIYQAVEQLESILLQADGLLLLPECIFVDYRTENIYFCYCPGNGKDLPKAFEELMQYLLTKADHGDKRVVELVYAIYDRATKGDGSLLELKDMLRMPYEKDVPEEEMDEIKCEEMESIAVEKSVTAHKGSIQKEASQESAPFQREDLRQIQSEQNAYQSISQRKRKKGSGDFLGKIGLNSMVKKICNYWEMNIRKGTPKRKSRRAIPEEEFVFEPEEEVTQISRPTVLLAELTKPPEGVLRYEGKGLCKDLVIEGDAYVIGSDLECGGYIPSTTVSRRHAKITQKEGIYFMEDLNSSNGTYVGGEMLNYKTKVSLQKNEIVIFADEKFRFI